MRHARRPRENFIAWVTAANLSPDTVLARAASSVQVLPAQRPDRGGGVTG
jgi:hypothetical protein